MSRMEGPCPGSCRNQGGKVRHLHMGVGRGGHGSHHDFKKIFAKYIQLNRNPQRHLLLTVGLVDVSPPVAGVRGSQSS